MLEILYHMPTNLPFIAPHHFLLISNLKQHFACIVCVDLVFIPEKIPKYKLETFIFSLKRYRSIYCNEGEKTGLFLDRFKNIV